MSTRTGDGLARRTSTIPGPTTPITRELVVSIGENFPNVTVLFNDKVLVRDGLTKSFTGHDNHLHVRFA